MDKVQKIRKEVERLQNELIQEKEKGFGSDADDACILELQNILTYIDSLQKEPVIEDAPSEDYVKGFADGRLYEQRQKPVTSVWHDASEMPEKDKVVLLRMVNGEVFLAEITKSNPPLEIGEMWAYVDDLLKL